MFLNRLSELDDAAKKAELETLRKSNPKLFEQFNQLASAAEQRRKQPKCEPRTPPITGFVSGISDTQTTAHRSNVDGAWWPKVSICTFWYREYLSSFSPGNTVGDVFIRRSQIWRSSRHSKLLAQTNQKTLRYALRIAPEDVVEHLHGPIVESGSRAIGR